MLNNFKSFPPKPLNKVVVRLIVDGGNVNLNLEVSHFHILNSPLEVNCVRVVNVEIAVREEDKWVAHKDVD